MANQSEQLIAELQRQLDEARRDIARYKNSHLVLAAENTYLKSRVYGPNSHPAALELDREIRDYFTRCGCCKMHQDIAEKAYREAETILAEADGTKVD